MRPQSTHGLRLHVADTFLRRLLGLHAWGPLGPDEALLLTPCRSIHTFFLRWPIDIVFLDQKGGQCRCIRALPPCRAVFVARASMVVELPAGYCDRHPDYLDRIHAALHLRVSPCLSA